MSRSRCRPEHGARVAAGYGTLLLMWLAVAHASGSGWVQATGGLVVGLALVGLLSPWLVLRRVRVTCTRAPVDATAGTPFGIDLVTNAAVILTPLRPEGEPTAAPFRGAHVALVACPRRRGTFCALEIQASTSFPFGLLTWSKGLVVDLPSRIHVAPRTGTPLVLGDVATRGSSPGRRALRPGQSGELRQVRDYRPGDRRARVHWPASAHSGSLVVRVEEEPFEPSQVLLVADLPADPEAAELRAESLLATVLLLFRMDVAVLLETVEEDGTTQRSVVSGPLETRRRLARCVARSDATPPQGTVRSGR